MTTMTVDAGPTPIPPEPSIPACSCRVCKHPTAQNADERADHAASHVGFAEWLADNRPAELQKKPAYADMLRWRIQEDHVQSGRCVSPRCAVSAPHPAHLVRP